MNTKTKQKKGYGLGKVLSILIVFLLLVQLLMPMVVLANSPASTVFISVENNTYTKADGAPWDGVLLDKYPVEINSGESMMDVIGTALSDNNITVEGLNDGYISNINGLAAFDGGSSSGWMGTLNDWFTNNGFAAMPVADGDIIDVQYTCSFGEDLGGSWSNNDTSIKSLVVSDGELTPTFNKSTNSYTLTVPNGTTGLKITPTASNKNFQARIFLGSQEYKRTQTLPIEDGTVITVGCGHADWPTMNGDSITGTDYTITVKEESDSSSPLKLDKTAANLGDTVTFTVHSSEPANANKPYEIYFLDVDGNTFTSDKLWSPDNNAYYSDTVYAYGTLDGSGNNITEFKIPTDINTGEYGFKVYFYGTGEEISSDLKLTINSPGVNKGVLQSAISAANSNKASAVVSLDGTDVETAQKWVTQGSMTAYETAIATAQGVFNKTDAAQVEVNQAVTDLSTATGTFNNAKKDGTKQATYTVTFNAGENGALTASVDGKAVVTGSILEKGKDVLFTASPAENYRVKEWTVDGKTVSGNKTTALTVSSVQASKVITVAFEKIPASIAFPVNRQTIVDALNKATDKLIEKFDDSSFNYQQHWMAIDINGFGKKVPDSYLNAIKNGDMPKANSGQYGKYILGILAAGGDPTNINGRNLLAELCQLSDMKNVNTEGGIYTTPFGLLALDAVNYKIPAGAGFTRDDIINKLITLASPSGGEDGVGFVLTALGKYYNEKPKVKEAVDEVVAAWAARQGEDGGFGAGQWSTANNVNTAAQVLMGLSSNGIDPQSVQFTKAKGNLISFILNLQNADGTFNWQKDDAGSVSMATEQAVYALDQYLRQLDGKKSIYDFTSKDPEAPDITAPVISTDLADKTVNASVFTFTASANDALDGPVVPVVKLGDNVIAGTNGTYKVNLSEGSNKITVSAADSSANKSEKSFTIVYAAKTQEIPTGDKPKVEIPSDNNDYKVPITAGDSNKEITIEIPDNNAARVLVELPLKSSLPEIVAAKGNVTVLIPKGIKVTSGNASQIELITSKDTTDTTIKNKVNDIIADGKKLDSIVQAFSMGDGVGIRFDGFVTLTFKGMQGKEAAYIQSGILHPVQKFASDSEGLASAKDEYAYDSGNDLVVKTKHFTDFIAYSTSTVQTPQVKKYVTLSVDKLTINEGYVISSIQAELQPGDTAWTLLKRELDKRGISYKYIWTEAYGSVYVQSIDGDGEFDHGSGSGWMYNVNGWYPNYGATKYILKEGDSLQWRYTTNLGADLGEDLSKWDNPDTAGLMPVIAPGDKTPTIEIPKDIQKDYTLKITKDLTNTENITISIPEVNSKVILNLEAVKGDLPKLTAVRGNTSLVIDKGTQIKAGNSSIEILTAIDANDANILKLINGSLDGSEQRGKISNAFALGNTNDTVLFDKPVTLIFKGAKGQSAGFIEGNKFSPVEIYETEEQGALATKDSEKKVYAFIKGNDLYIKTNHFTTFVSYTVSDAKNDNIDLKKIYTDESSISSWAYQAISDATKKGFLSGSNGKFNPKSNITRAEFIKIMVSVLGLDISIDKVISFNDVKENNWFYPYVNAAYKAGIIKGSGDKFYPNDKITREQMAAIIIRALGVKPSKPVTAIKDINSVSSCFKTDVETIFALGLMVGDSGKFSPKDLATREMAAVVAMKAYAYGNGGYTKTSEVKKYIDETGALMQKTVSDPVVASVGGEWTILSLARSGIKVPDSYYDKYYSNVVKKLKETSGILHNVKYTEYDRVILALSSIGKDVTNVAGYDLTKPLADFNTLIKQGLNGPVWALIALDSKGFQIPSDKTVTVQTTREMLVKYILSKEIAGGGWSLTSDAPADTDITAMALQALAKYQDNKDVKAAIDRALNFLSSVQQADGTFKSSWGDGASSESIAQVIVALTSLNIDPTTDKRFIKNGMNPVSALLKFYIAGGGFKHTLDGELDAMATDQGMYALVAYDRFVNGQKALYDMTDVN